MSQAAVTPTATPALFSFPPQAKVGRVVAKKKIYERGSVGSKLRDKFVAQVEQITWAYKLAPETINLPARGSVVEIQIFDIALKTAELDEDILRAIDRVIPLPIIFQLHHEQRTCMVATFKRPSEADASKWVIDGYFAGNWLSVDSPREPMPVALDLQGLYGQLLRWLLPNQARPDESLHEQLVRLDRLRSLYSDCAKLDARLHKEKQFNRKVVLNAQLREVQNEIAELSA
ncbi:DUF4391 domain-containing protein [Pseudomonas sp. CFBP 8771]|uniref:DUF4391 domain-containing protein n=1 Tax=Pseudomonas sp. CFBP 8771 TaxID=2775285 RepID=UPI001786EA0A|nr:DUF4391 domain-containing protein [Pseudomonas sp. CFBP 8771]MBD8604922.1 DUF4391 domain-containing protein [Pseudomonas sp. CFBP 8771]